MRRDCKDCVCMGCIEYKKYKSERRIYFEQGWESMSHDERFDYIMGNWSEHYCRNKGMGHQGIPYEVESLIYNYLTNH